MPLRGQGHSDLVRDEVPYFKSLAELDAWFARPHDKLLGVVPYQPRPNIDGQSDTRGKLLICHDYKWMLLRPSPPDGVSDRMQFNLIYGQGGYNETPSGLCYTFNFWRLCDTFIYFSHNRVAAPPSGWINAAHRQGTRILGTLIFEGFTSQPDCLQLIVGRANHVVTDDKIPISKHYAVLLAELAHQRGFDGYLLNFEFDLQYETNQAHALAAWILLLKTELRAKVGAHAQVMWYDSIIYNGMRAYQNRLNGYNLPFFLAADTFFTNYWWKPATQHQMTQYFAQLGRARNFTGVTSLATKTLQSIYSGVDVWPDRGQYGNSGFFCYRAVTHTSPLGLSTALFAPGWTWEGAVKDAEKNWSMWWDIERKFWLGPLKPGEIIRVPDSPEGPFKPMSAFFGDFPPPDPANLVFYTNFSPGVGYSWFVEGKKVLDTKDGWSDIDKQCSIGNLVWPWPTLSLQGAQQENVTLTASTALDMTDGYNGGNTLKLTLTYTGDSATKSIWLPVQSLTLTTQTSFETRIVYKTTVDTDVDLSSQIFLTSSPSGGISDSADFTTGETIASASLRGWTQQTVWFTSTSPHTTASVQIGFWIRITLKNPSDKVTFSFSLGQLAVYPTPPPPSRTPIIGAPAITSAKFTPVAPETPAAATSATRTLKGVLTWDTTSTFAPINVRVDRAESTTPAWLLQDTPAYRFPTFAYFNIYAMLLDHLQTMVDPVDPVFVGTTGFDGRLNRFYVEQACLPAGWDACAGIKFYVQGVTDRGEVLPWERCATADHRGNPHCGL